MECIHYGGSLGTPTINLLSYSELITTFKLDLLARLSAVTPHPPLDVFQWSSPLNTHHSLLTTHYSPLNTHYSLLTTHHPSPITHHLLLTTHYSLLTTHHSLLTTHYSLLTTHHSLLTTHHSSLNTHYSLLTKWRTLATERRIIWCVDMKMFLERLMAARIIRGIRKSTIEIPLKCL